MTIKACLQRPCHGKPLGGPARHCGRVCSSQTGTLLCPRPGAQHLQPSPCSTAPAAQPRLPGEVLQPEPLPPRGSPGKSPALLPGLPHHPAPSPSPRGGQDAPSPLGWGYWSDLGFLGFSFLVGSCKSSPWSMPVTVILYLKPSLSWRAAVSAPSPAGWHRG